MNIREALLKEHTKKNTTRIVDYIDADKDRFAELMDLFFNDVYRVNQIIDFRFPENGFENATCG